MLRFLNLNVNVNLGAKVLDVKVLAKTEALGVVKHRDGQNCYQKRNLTVNDNKTVNLYIFLCSF